jgi:integrase
LLVRRGKLRPPPTGRLEIFDSIVPAMALRVTSKGAKSFVVRCRVKGWSRPIRVTIGDALSMKLSDARQEASDVLKVCRTGNDPRVARKAKAEETTSSQRNTFSVVAERFISDHVAKLRSKSHTEAEIRRYLIAPWAHRPIASITLDDVAERISQIIDSGTPHMARLVLAHAKRLFRWAAAPGRPRETRLQVNPCAGLSAKKDFDIAINPRRVTLGNDHLRLIWKAAESLNDPFGPFFKMLLLSGQRRREVAEMSWTELDLDRDLVWLIPAERMKAKRAHEVPLTVAMVELLTKLRESRGKGEFVFSTTSGERPISGFSKIKSTLDQKVAELRVREREQAQKRGMALPPVEVPGWRIHDARRTMRTGLGAIPTVPQNVRELVIAHVPPELVQTYDLHAYRQEKRDALELWSQRLITIVTSAA